MVERKNAKVKESAFPTKRSRIPFQKTKPVKAQLCYYYNMSCSLRQGQLTHDKADSKYSC